MQVVTYNRPRYTERELKEVHRLCEEVRKRCNAATRKVMGTEKEKEKANE